MQKKPLVFFLCCSDNIIFAAGNVALALNKYMPNEQFDIIIYHTGLRPANALALKKIPRVILKNFKFDGAFQDEILKRMPKGRWSNPNSLLAFSHYEIFDFLYEYKTAIWLDADISVQANISELCKYGPFGQSKDLNWHNIWTVGDQFIKPLPKKSGYDMSTDGYINALIVVNDQLPHWKEMRDYCYRKSLEYAEYLKNCDQAVFAMLRQDFGIQVNEIPWHEYICHAQHPYASLAKVVHFGCQDKVWTDDRYLRTFPEWFRTHLEWLQLGGEDFDRSNMSSISMWFSLYGNPQCNCIDLNPDISTLVKKTRILLLGLMPLTSFFQCKNEFSLKFFGIPIIRMKEFGPNKKVWFIFNKIEMFKTKFNVQQQTTSYYFFGIPMIKIHSYCYVDKS